MSGLGSDMVVEASAPIMPYPKASLEMMPSFLVQLSEGEWGSPLFIQITSPTSPFTPGAVGHLTGPVVPD